VCSFILSYRENIRKHIGRLSKWLDSGMGARYGGWGRIGAKH